jgi:hypothetical protein
VADEPVAQPGGVRLSPILAETLSPLLADWIVASRDAAIASGVQPIPAAIRSALAGYVPDDTLERVRWRVGDDDEITLQHNLVQFGDVPAVTLDHVVVFKDRRVALEDPKLWAHELKHVMQFAEWGVGGFVTRYLKDYEAVEKEAAEYRWQFMKQAGLIPLVPGAATTGAD